MDTLQYLNKVKMEVESIGLVLNLVINGYPSILFIVAPDVPNLSGEF